jgi:Cu(I)/Ag(I) efflux system membrane fusion protein
VATVKIDPAITQNLGMRLVTVKSGPLAATVEAVGMVGFNERDVAVVQARSGGFVERVYARAPGDRVTAGSPLVDLLVPEWTAAQTEFLALRAHADTGLLAAARQRLRLSGIPQALIEQLERTGRPQPVVTITMPITGAIQQLDIRAGMTVAAGQTLARINGLATVWLEVAVPEARAGALRVGQGASARFAAFPGEVLPGRVTAILPEANPDSRTLKVRVELPNRQQRLKPGLTAQVRLEGAGTRTVMRIPTEAVIRTGKRALVIVAEPGGHYRPVEVRLGPEIDGDSVILKGLAEGQQIVASGQFLIDSEARLSGVTAPLDEAHEPIGKTGGQP